MCSLAIGIVYRMVKVLPGLSVTVEGGNVTTFSLTGADRFDIISLKRAY